MTIMYKKGGSLSPTSSQTSLPTVPEYGAGVSKGSAPPSPLTQEEKVAAAHSSLHKRSRLKICIIIIIMNFIDKIYFKLKKITSRNQNRV